MHAVAEFVRQGHHVPRLAVVVQQQIGMHAGHRRMREGAAGLAGFQPRVDPRFVEEAAADRGQFGAERAIRVSTCFVRVRPLDQPVVIVRQRRVAIPVLQFRQPQPLAFIW